MDSQPPTPLAQPTQQEDRFRRMEELIQSALKILSSVGMQEILWQTVKAAAHLGRADAVWLALEQPMTRTLIYQMAYPRREGPPPRAEEYAARSISSLLWGEGGQADQAQEARPSRQVTHPLEGAIYAILAVPLRYGNHTVGVLEVMNKETARGFSREQRDDLTTLAQFATNAITNAQVLEETMHLFENSLVLQAEKSRQEEIANLRARFTQQLAHELRNQIGIVRMAIKQYQLRPEQAEDTIRTIEGCNYLEEMLLADVLDQAQIDTGSFNLRKQRLALPVFFEPLRRIYTILAEDADKRLTWELAEPLPAVEADPKRLSQVMLNLVSNAIKYTRADGRIVIRAVTEDGQARVTVSDNGIGIPADQQPRIFQRGFRGQPDLAGGEGLGLYFVRYLIQQHDGDIGFTSRAGEGSEFWFSLPVAPHPPPSPAGEGPTRTG